MTPQAFIESRLAQLREPIAVPTEGSLEERIFTALMSKKFRKYASTEVQRKGMREAIHLAIERNEPIQFVFPFGAYKLWRFDETPVPDWAELFTLIYYTRWLLPVSRLYEPGVRFDFVSDEVVIERMNNISKAETAEYARSLENLFEFLKPSLPGNISFRLVPVGSFYSSTEEFDADLGDRIAEAKAALDRGWPELTPEQKAQIELNVRLKPGQDTDPHWREEVDIIHHAYYRVTKRRPYLADRARIAVFPTLLANYNAIAVGTTKTSIAKFWVGVGALERRGDSFIETVLSPSQLTQVSYDWEPVSIDGLSGKNFGRVRVLR